jgi:uncharacterized membrane protein YfcA
VLAIAESPAHALWIVLGFAGAVFSGMFGIGVVLTVPLLLYVPPLVGRQPLPIHIIAGTTTVQVAVVGLMGALSHVKDGLIRWSLIPLIAGTMAPAALLGAAWSRAVSGRVLEAVFILLIVAAAVILIARRGDAQAGEAGGNVPARRLPAMLLGAALGFLVGMVGLGGGFLLVPLMVYVLRVPLRIAIGSSLGILAVTGIAGMIGKAVTGQIDWIFAAALVAGALPGVRVGAWLGKRIDVRQLSFALGVVLALLAVKMCWDMLAA